MATTGTAGTTAVTSRSRSGRSSSASAAGSSGALSGEGLRAVYPVASTVAMRSPTETSPE